MIKLTVKPVILSFSSRFCCAKSRDSLTFSPTACFKSPSKVLYLACDPDQRLEQWSIGILTLKPSVSFWSSRFDRSNSWDSVAFWACNSSRLVSKSLHLVWEYIIDRPRLRLKQKFHLQTINLSLKSLLLLLWFLGYRHFLEVWLLYLGI